MGGLVDLRFAGLPSGTFAATWSQREFWATINEHRPDGFYQIAWAVHFPDGRKTDEVQRCLEHLIARHQALRTKITGDERSGLRQVVYGEGSIPARVQNVIGMETVPDACEGIMREFLAGEPLLARDFPLKVALVTHDGLVRSIVLACSHMVLDGGSVGVLEEEIDALLDESGPAALPPVAHRPEDQARDESLDRSAKTSERSLAYWRSTLADSPTSLFPHVRGGGAPLWLGRLMSEALFAAESSLVSRAGLSSSALYLSASACVLTEVTGKTRMAFRVPTNNRFTASRRSFVGALSQHAIVSVDTASGSFYDLVRRVERGLRRAYCHARYDPEELRKVIREVESAHGAPLDLTYLFNDLRDEADKPRATDPAPVRGERVPDTSVSEVSWEMLHASNSDIKLYIRVCGSGHTGGLDVAADTDCLTRAETENILRATERLIIEAAGGDFRISDARFCEHTRPPAGTEETQDAG